MTESAVDPPGKYTSTISMEDSKIDSIRVRVLFSGLKKEELDVSGKTLNIRGLKFPMSRFGSWIYQTVGFGQENGKRICEIGGAAAGFIYALHRTYPEISAWISDTSNCSFILEVEEIEKRRILDEIGSGKMQHVTQKILSDLGYTLKMIIITREKKPQDARTEETMSSSTKSSPKIKTETTESELNDSGMKKPTADKYFRYLKLRSEKASEENEKDKLKKLVEFATCSIEIGKFHEDMEVVDEIKALMGSVQIPQESVRSFLSDIRKISQFFHDEEDPVGSMEMLLASSNIIGQINKSEDRIDSINDTLIKICDTIAMIFKVKSTSIDVAVGLEDEQGGSNTEIDSGTGFSQTNKEHLRGKGAFKAYNYDEALRFYDAAIKIQPKKMLYHLDKAEVYLAQGKFEECKRECNIVVESDDVAENKARAKEILGEVELRCYYVFGALQKLEQSLKLSPSASVKDKFTKLEQSAMQVFNAIQQSRLHMTMQRMRLPLVVPR